MTPTRTRKRARPAGRAALPPTSQQTEPAVALVDGPYDRWWLWRRDFDTYRKAGSWRHLRDYRLTNKQIVNHARDLEHLVGDVAEYVPPARKESDQ